MDKSPHVEQIVAGWGINRGRVAPRQSGIAVVISGEEKPCPNDESRDKSARRSEAESAATRAATRLSDDRLELLCRAILADGLVYHSDEAMLTSAMVNVKVSREGEANLHDQVAAQLRQAIADGEATPGERLPPAKDLAAVAGVNANTVLRALRILRDEGLLEFSRGRGVRVVGTPERGALLAKARELLDQARRDGVERDELLRILSALD